MSLTKLSNHLHGSPLRPLVEAQLVRIAGADVRNPNTSPERRAWANQILETNGMHDSTRVMGVVLTNPTIMTALEAGNTPPDGDIEYVVIQEALPVVVPEN